MSFEGEIGEIDLIERLVELGGEQFTGAIVELPCSGQSIHQPPAHADELSALTGE